MKAAIRAILPPAIAIGAIFGILAFSLWLNRPRYPYGPSHCCIKGMMFALLDYADAHERFFPAGEVTPEASLSLLYREGFIDAETLRGKTVPEDVTRAILENGGLLGPDTTGWHYVEGLTRNDDRRIAILWDEVGLGHNGQVTHDGGREVVFVDGSIEWISGKDWDAFLKEQEKLLANRTERAKKAMPVLVGKIRLPDGTVVDEWDGHYELEYSSSDRPLRRDGCSDADRPLRKALTWHHPPIYNGTMTYTLTLSGVQCDPVAVEFKDGEATPDVMIFTLPKGPAETNEDNPHQSTTEDR